MTEKEKVLASLKACAREHQECSCKERGCAYWDEDWCYIKLAADTLRLLKKLEEYIVELQHAPVYANVVSRSEEREWDCCENCGSHVINKWRWCPYCGRRLNWEDG